MRNMQSDCRALYMLGQVVFPPPSAPAWFCPILNQAELVFTQSLYWSFSGEKHWHHNGTLRFWAFCTGKGMEHFSSSSRVSFNGGAKRSTELGNSCWLPCKIPPEWSNFEKMFSFPNRSPKLVKERKADELKLNKNKKDLRHRSYCVSHRNEGARERTALHTAAITVSSGMKCKAGPVQIPQALCTNLKASRKAISAKYVLIGFGIYSSFLWPDRESCLNGILAELLKLQHGHSLIFKWQSNDVGNENSQLSAFHNPHYMP